MSRLDGEGERLMADVRSLRDATYLLLSAWIDEVSLPKGPLLVANHWLLRARQNQSLSENGLLTLRAEPGDLRIPLKRIALDLVDTLADARAGKFRLKHCANQSSCGWIFADTSKNGRRRWCAMQTCGTVSKTETRRNKGLGSATGREQESSSPE
jgi:predicted RNA-binding Zn ribbon-like protein